MHDTIRSYIETDLLGGQPIDNTAPLLAGGMIDSLAVMRLIAHLEKTFSIKVPAKDMKIKNFGSVDAIAAYVTRSAA